MQPSADDEQYIRHLSIKPCIALVFLRTRIALGGNKASTCLTTTKAFFSNGKYLGLSTMASVHE